MRATCWDVLYGWPTGAGDYSTRQATLAAQFYQNVISNGAPGSLTLPDLYGANVTFVGHSMGGGLALNPR
jgi:pimeloyl-ACP methyl ester carboxylesterase